MAISDNIKFLRDYADLSQADFGALFGVSDKAVSTWEKGTREPRMGIIQKMADKFGLRKSDIIDGDVCMLLGHTKLQTSSEVPDGFIPLPSTSKIPLVGTIACGVPILAEENIEGYVDLPDNIRADFALRCKGDSMIGARIKDGDIVYIRTQPVVDNGQIAAVRVGEEATLKRVYIYPNKVILQAENPSFEPLVFINSELDQIDIIGKAVAFTSVIQP